MLIVSGGSFLHDSTIVHMKMIDQWPLTPHC